MSHPTPEELVRDMEDVLLHEVMGLCSEEPAEPEKCVACAAYMEAQRRA